MSGNDKERIEKLKQSLYSKQNGPQVDPTERQALSAHEDTVEDDWKQKVREAAGRSTGPRIWRKLVLGGAGIFLLIALGISAYFFLGGLNFVSADNVEVSIDGPVSVGGGEELSFDVIVTNNNNEHLENVVMVVEYPSGTRSAENVEEELSRRTQQLNNISPGETVRTNMKAALFGEIDSEQTVRIVLEYNLPDSSGQFAKTIEYPVTMSSAPLVMEIVRPEDVFSNQTVDFEIRIESNSNTVLENILLHANYPFGFTFVSSDVDPTFGNNTWLIDDLEPREEMVITLSGRIEGNENEERTVDFSVGVQSSDNEKAIAATFARKQEVIRISRPLVDARVLIGGSSSSSGFLGNTVQGQVEWENTSGETLRNVEIGLLLTSSILNESSVTVKNGGFYQSLTNRISWDKNTTSSLSEVEPGERGAFGFSFATFPPTDSLYRSARNPSVDFVVEAEGQKPNGASVFVATESDFRINSDTVLLSEGLRSSGPFANSGPYPPRVEQNSTYTVHWKVNNSFNSLEQTEMRAILPPYVEWRGQTSPGGENVQFSPSTREVVWTLGDVSAGAGFSRAARDVYFQIGFTPSANQEGDRPDIVGDTFFKAIDAFTKATLTAQLSELSTAVPNDPAHGLESGRVTN